MEFFYQRRALAFTIDILVALTPFWLLLPAIIIFANNPGVSDQLAAQALLLLAPIPSLLLYFIIQLIQISRARPTPGRRLAKINITDLEGQPPGTLKAFSREMVGIFIPLALILFFNLWPLLLLVPCWALASKDGRSLHDQIAGTKVVPLRLSEASRKLPWE